MESSVKRCAQPCIPKLLIPSYPGAGRSRTQPTALHWQSDDCSCVERSGPIGRSPIRLILLSRQSDRRLGRQDRWTRREDRLVERIARCQDRLVERIARCQDRLVERITRRPHRSSRRITFFEDRFSRPLAINADRLARKPSRCPARYADHPARHASRSSHSAATRSLAPRG